MAATDEMTDATLIPVPAVPAEHRYRHVQVSPVTGACGAIVDGVDLAVDLDDEVVAEIRRAVLDHKVVFFRGQRLSAEEQVAFSRRFGPYSPVPFIEPLAEHPEVIAVVREAEEAQSYTFGSLWHSDFSFLPEPPFASILYALEVPSAGGDTIWANQELAYSALSTGMRTMLEGLTGVHSAVNAYSPKMQAIHDTFVGMTVHTNDDANRTERHPVVRVHGETGRKVLYANAQYTVGLDGFSPFDAKPILDFLFSWTTRTELQCRWRWEVGDVAMWDNRAVQHLALADFTGHRRHMHRTTVAGERPAGVGSGS